MERALLRAAGRLPVHVPWRARRWFPHFAEGTTPFTVLVEDGPDVVGLAPLVVRRRGPFRLLAPVGMEPGDHWSPLAEPGRREEVHRAVTNAVAEASGAWDAWLLRSADGPAGEALRTAGLRWRDGAPVPAPAITLPASFDAYMSELSKSRRSNLRRHLKRLDEGEVTIRAVAPQGLGPALEHWQDLRRRQWDRGRRPHRTRAPVRALRRLRHRRVRGADPPRRGRSQEFVRDGEVIGSYVNFMNAAAYHWYLGGYDPGHRSLGLGKIAIGQGIRSSIERGRATYDFGRGAEPYKYWIGAEDRWQAVRLVGSDTVRSRLALRAGAAKMTRLS